MSNILPFIVQTDLTQNEINNFQIQFKDTKRNLETGLWRRKDDLYTFSKFGTEKDSRRFRTISFKTLYEINNRALQISKINISVYIGCPQNEIFDFYNSKLNLFKQSKNVLFIEEKSKKLCVKCKISNVNIDISDYTDDPKLNEYSVYIPENYKVLKYNIRSDDITGIEINEDNVWEVFLRPYRDENFAQKPKYINIEDNISEFFPCQIMLGCGPSIETGVPPLNALHSIYKVGMSKEKKGFIYTSEDDLINDFVNDASKALKNISYSYLKCIEAKYSDFYTSLSKGYKSGIIVGDILNNNFDGLILRESLPEKYLRVFESTLYIPKIEFHKDAKSLVVIGNHADRRQVIRAARKAGLKVLYVDPEGYNIDEKFIPYPLVETLKTDYLLKTTAQNFSKILDTYLP